jgi:hypothetical protein
MMFKFDGVNQNGAWNCQTCLLQLVVFLDCSLRTSVRSYELLDKGVQTSIFDQALIFPIRELLYGFQLGYGIR